MKKIKLIIILIFFLISFSFCGKWRFNEKQSEKIKTSFLAACKNGDIDKFKTIKKIIVENFKVKESRKYIGQCLVISAFKGRIQIIKQVLENKVKIEKKIIIRSLISASYGGYLHIIQYLLTKASNKIGTKAKGKAIISSLRGFKRNSNYNRIIELLIKNNADLDARYEGNTALIFASSRGFEKIVKKLIEKGADVNAVGGMRKTALIWASIQGYYKIAKILVENGANVNMRALYGETALLYAAKNGHFKIAKLLVERGANVNVETSKVTPLMLAAQYGHFEIVKFLVKHDAKINSISDVDSSAKQDGSGYGTVLDYALGGVNDKTNPKVIKYLRSKGAKTYKELRKRGHRKRK